MAEFVISKLAEAVLSHSVERITVLLIDEAVSLKSVKADVEKLLDELKMMKCFLKDADRKQHQDESVRNWIKQVKEVSEKVEDVIEIYITEVSTSSFNFFKLRRLKKEINSVQEKLDHITKMTQTYKIAFSRGEEKNSDNELLRRRRRSGPDDDDDDTDDVTSLENTMKTLQDQLMEPRDELCIVSIVGMGGLGKTFLAKKLYNQSDVKQHFDCCAWLCISQQYDWDDVLRQILVQLETDVSQRDKLRGLKGNELVGMLKEKLKEKRYLVVLDDIWEIKAWDGIKAAFPKGKCGSKVVFTTRNKEVASGADPNSSLIEPPFLSIEDSWKLLQRKVFRRDALIEHKERPRLEEMGKHMAGKCGGLPLAVVTLGGLLKTMISFPKWEEVQRDLNAYLNKIHTKQVKQPYEGVNSILALSYDHLPYYLKPCFLYLASFREDPAISKKMLIQLLIADGLIVQETMAQSTNQEKVMLEEIVERYLEEMVDRYMIRVTNEETYRIHDLLRDLSLEKARDENFLEVVHQNHQMDSISSRRIVNPDGHIDLTRYQGKTHPRSLLCWLDVHPLCINERFLLLRVLHTCINISDIKKLISLGTLIHLRYLWLFVRGHSPVRAFILDSIKNCRNLRTLYLKGYRVEFVIPKKKSMLTSLTYLEIQSGKLTLEGMEELWFDSLVKLNTVSIKAHQAMLIFNSSLIRSGNLRSLTLTTSTISTPFI